MNISSTSDVTVTLSLLFCHGYGEERAADILVLVALWQRLMEA
jgi:hypothetical protein